METGETWAYRVGATGPIQPVRIVRRGVTRKKHALVVFEAPEAEGHQDWIPEGRLKVLWDERDVFLQKEERWDAVRRASGNVTEAEEWAARIVLDELDSHHAVQFVPGKNSSGVAVITEWSDSMKRLGLDESVLIGEALAFEEEGSLVVPWSTTELLVRTLAKRNAAQLLESIQYQEDHARAQAVVALQRQWNFNNDPVEPPGPSQWERTIQDARNIVRIWCGTDALDQWHEIRELRQEVARLGSLVAKAATVLEAKGHKRDATEIRKLHGLPEGLQVGASYPAIRKRWASLELPG